MQRCPTCDRTFPDEFALCPMDGTSLESVEVDDPFVGQTLLGTYRVESFLRSGGMSRVYVAVNDRIGRRFAVKVLDPSLARDEVAVERFLLEARSAAELRHPHIVYVVDSATTDEGLPFIVMELLEGDDADDVVSRDGQLEIGRAVEIVAQAADALHAAHGRSIVHRDIKPSNLFLARSTGGGEHVKVLDFGLAVLKASPRLTPGSQIFGTPEYMSPEQIRSSGTVDHRSDIYSLGATLFHLVCGRPPFEGDAPVAILISHLTDEPPSPRQIRNDLPETVEQLILQMLAKDPAARPQSAGELRDELNALTDAGFAAQERGDRLNELPREDEIRVVTVLVADVEPVEGDDVEAHIERSAAAFRTLSRAVEGQGGQVEQLVGNRSLGVFGLELSFGDEPVRAVRAANRLRQTLSNGVQLRVAVATGRTLARPGAASTGLAASMATRMLTRAPLGAVIIDATTYCGVRGVFKARLLDDESGGYPAYEVPLGAERADLHTGGRALDVRASTVGRDDVIDEIQSLFTWTVEERQPSVVCISGEVGVGKSRLKTDLALWLEEFVDHEVIYLEGASHPLVSEQHFSAIADVIRRRAQLPAGCSWDAAVAGVRAVIDEAGMERNAGEVAEVLVQTCCLAEKPRITIANLEVAPQRLREQTIEAFVTLIVTMAETQPVVLCVEDAHCLDVATLDTLARLPMAATGLPLMVLVVGRPRLWELVEGTPLVAAVPVRIDLEPLSRAGARELLTALIGGGPPTALYEAVWRLSEGVPLFVEEAVSALRQRGYLRLDIETDTWVLKDADDVDFMPATIRGLLQARLDALPAELRPVLRRAAVVGTTFWDGALEALGSGGECTAHLAALAQRQTVLPSPSSTMSGCREYEFRSLTLHDATYETIPTRERAELHSRAADWLLEHGARPGVLAHHLERAGRHIDAALQLVHAGVHAAASYANDTALQTYDAALRLLEGDEVMTERIEALFGKEAVLARIGRRDTALAVLEEVNKTAKSAGDAASAARAAVRRGALVRLKDPPRASEILEDALEQCRSIGDAELESEALRHLAQATAFSGHLDRGSGAAAEAVAVARRVGSKALLFEALMCQGTISNIRDGHWHALPPFEEALDIVREVKSLEREADILMRTGYLRTELGDVEKAVQELERARALCEKTGNRRVLAYTLHNLGWALWKAGKATEARAAEEEALELSREAELGHVEVVTKIYLALFDIGEGAAETGLERAKKARDVSDSEGHAEPVMHSDMVITIALLALERFDEAADAAGRCTEAYERLGGTQQFEVEIHLVAQSAFEAVDDFGSAERSKAAARDALQRRLAPITDSAVRKRLSASIGEGLPSFYGRP